MRLEFDVCLAWRTGRASDRGVGSNKKSAVTGRKGNANKARAFPEMGCLEEA